MRLGRRLSAPSLQEYSYSSIDGRLLPGEAGPVSQLLYEVENHERPTFCLASLSRTSLSFRVGNRGTVDSFPRAAARSLAQIAGGPGILRVLMALLLRPPMRNRLSESSSEI